MSRLLRTSAIVIAAGSLALSGCGSSGDDEASDTTTTAVADTTTTADTAGDFAGALNELCVTGQDTTDAAGEDLQAALDDLTAADSSGDTAAYATALDQAETATEDAIGAFEDFLAAVDELDVPADAQTALDDLTASVEERLSLTQDLRDAIAADDGGAFTDAFNALRDANDRLDQAADDAAAALDAPDCASRDDSSSATPDTTDTTSF